MNPHYSAVARRAGRRCEYCHAPEAVFNIPFEIEHIIPLAQGGADDLSNLALSCRACNLHKSHFLTGTDETTQVEERLFHPRLDRWDEHFQVDTESGEIQGMTSVGRATISRLDINHPLQLLARQIWIRLGLFP